MAKIKGNKNDNTLNGTALDDTLIGKSGDDSLFGNDGNDLLKAGNGNDHLDGGNGDDILNGGAGDDHMIGGEGADQFNGGTGIDTVDYSTATTYVKAYFNSGFTEGSALGDTYSGNENLIGTAFNDFLQAGDGGMSFGGAGNDNLYGADYSNTGSAGTLRGDAGNDTLNMNYGNTKAWVQLGQGTDTIVGFDEGADMLFIDLSEFGLGTTFDTNEIHNSNSVTALGGTAQFIFEDDAQRLWFDSNGSTAGGLTLIAQFTGAAIDGSNLGTDDFQFQL